MEKNNIFDTIVAFHRKIVSNYKSDENFMKITTDQKI